MNKIKIPAVLKNATLSEALFDIFIIRLFDMYTGNGETTKDIIQDIYIDMFADVDIDKLPTSEKSKINNLTYIMQDLGIIKEGTVKLEPVNTSSSMKDVIKDYMQSYIAQSDEWDIFIDSYIKRREELAQNILKK